MSIKKAVITTFFSSLIIFLMRIFLYYPVSLHYEQILLNVHFFILPCFAALRTDSSSFSNNINIYWRKKQDIFKKLNETNVVR